MNKKTKIILVYVLFILFAGAAGYIVYQNSLGNNKENTNESEKNNNESLEINQDTINLYIEESFNENKKEIAGLANNVKKIQKLLQNDVNNKCKGTVSIATIKVLVDIYLEEKGYLLD